MGRKDCSMASSWLKSAVTTWEIAVAAPQVISARLAQMALAGSTPNKAEQAEFSLMGMEKVNAFGESMQAMAVPLLNTQQVLAKTLAQQWLHLLSPFAFRQPSGRALERSMMRVMDTGLAPVHRVVTANARRLGARKIR
ncbi:MAG: Proline dehydrogenase [Rhizobacter sp.]|nr:Proline dehydrogenase [Rhizobacter sp.]